jgi:tricorn protease
VTDGMSNVTNPAFDPNGKYLYFTASTDIGPAIDGFGLGSLNRTTTASVYVAVLSKYGVSPIPPQSDDEKAKDDKAKDDSDQTPAPTDAAKSEEKKDAATTDKKESKRKTRRRTTRRIRRRRRPRLISTASSSASSRCPSRRATMSR